MNTARRIGIGVAAIGAVALLSGCSALAVFAPGVNSAVFTSAKDFSASEGFTAPEWVPEDSTAVRISYSARDGGAILRVQPTFDPKDCDKTDHVPEVPIADSWWPTKAPESVHSCPDGWSVFTSGDATFAYTSANIAS